MMASPTNRMSMALMAMFAILCAMVLVMPTGVWAQSTDATLASITVDGTGVPGFTSSRPRYEYGVDSTTDRVTIAATTTHSEATWAVTRPNDADTNTGGHQARLIARANFVEIRGTAEDTSTTRTYTINVNRGVTDTYGWKAVDDLDTLYGTDNHDPRRIWSDGTTIWVSDSVDEKLYAYNLGTKARDGDKDIDLHSGKGDARGIWSDGTTMWVSNERVRGLPRRADEDRAKRLASDDEVDRLRVEVARLREERENGRSGSGQ